MFSRYAFSVGPAFGVTFGLLMFMHLLIATGKSPMTATPVFNIPDFIFVDRPEAPPIVEKNLVRPPDVQPPPESTVTPSSDTTDAGIIKVTVPHVRTDAIQNQIAPLPLVDGDIQPLVKVAPIYPRQAQVRGLEGYVIVQFTVTAAGSVSDVTVIESSNHVFEKAAVQAAEKFRYKPRVIDGTAVAVRGVRNKITFKIEN